MKFKKYLVLEIAGAGKYRPYPEIKIKIKNGTTSVAIRSELKKDWTPDPKDRVYFFPGCSVPRFKVREKYKTTIKPEYATAAFMSPIGVKSSEDMFDVIAKAVLVDGKILEDWFEGIYGDDHHFVIKYKSLLLNCEDRVVVDENHLYRLKYGCPKNATKFPKTFSRWSVDFREKDYELNESDPLTFMSPVIGSSLAKLKCPIYNQDAILKLLNEDNVVIDEKRYEELRLMANSNDKENIILVMELMANANFKKSFVYLLLLLKEFNSEITARRKEIKHVNFAALLTFLELDPKKLDGINIEQLMTGMKKHKQFTRSNIQRLTQFFIPDSNRSFDTEHFTVGPVLKPEAEDLLDNDFEIQDDDDIQIVELKADNFNL